MSPTSSWALQGFASMTTLFHLSHCAFWCYWSFPQLLKWLHFQIALLADCVVSPSLLICLVLSEPEKPMSLRKVPTDAAGNPRHPTSNVHNLTFQPLFSPASTISLYLFLLISEDISILSSNGTVILSFQVFSFALMILQCLVLDWFGVWSLGS